MVNKTKLYFYYGLFVVAIFIFPERMNEREKGQQRATLINLPNHVSPWLFSMSRVLFFPSSSSRALFSIAQAYLFALAIFFHPLFLFSLRFKDVIFSRPPFFQPVLRFVSLLIFFFGHSCVFVFEVQGLPFLLEYFLPISSSCTRISSSTLFFFLLFIYLFYSLKLFQIL